MKTPSSFSSRSPNFTARPKMSAKGYFDASSFDIAAKGYFNAIKEALKPEKFHIQAPTPQLLRKAQQAAVDLKRPIPRDGQGRILPHPSRGSKSEIFKKEDFKDVDHHALHAPVSLLTANIEELVDYLVSPYEDDVSAVRAIVRWISGQDLRYYEVQNEASPNCAAHFLNELKNGKGRYDKIFNLMCKHAQIPSATISGHSKGIGYNVGDPLTASTHNMWNAVLLGEDWYLIDVHWASRKVSGVEAEEWQPVDFNRQKNEEIPHDVYEFDEFYFLTDPEEFIYSHFPDKEVWQLLARPLTLPEFQKVILLKPKFFQFDLKVKSHPWCTLKSVDGAVNIEINTNREDLSFSYELYRSTKVDCGQERLQKYLFLERNPEEKKVCVEIRFPTTGKFKAEIYGKDSKSKFEWLCSYVLYCEKPEANCMPLPTNLRSEWGPGVDIKKTGVIPLTHMRGKIFVDSVETEIKFKLDYNVDMIAQLMRVDEKNLDRYILLGMLDDIATVNVRIPQKGQYALCLFAKTDPSEKQFVNICNYLVCCMEDFGEVDPYPQTNNSRVGPLEIFHKLGLKMIDPLPGLTTVSQDGMYTFSVLVPQEIDYFPRMTFHAKEDFSDYAGWYRCGENVTFNLRFPKPGFYKFSLFAKSGNNEGGYPEVLCIVLEVPWPMTNCLPFPKRFSSYKDSYQIFSPNKRLLAIGKTEKVKVSLSDADEVAFIEGETWTHLQKNEDDCTWQGQIIPTGTAEIVSMAAKLSKSEGSFSAIMSFEVIDEKDLDHIFLTQKLSREEADQEYLERMSQRNNASKKSQGNSMMNQIQRIAKMKQQNLDDETLQRIQLQVDNEDNNEINDEDDDDDYGSDGEHELPVSDMLNNYFEKHKKSDQNYDHNGNDLFPRDVSDEDKEFDEKDEGENAELYPNSIVDINLNDIRKDPVDEMIICPDIKSQAFADNPSVFQSKSLMDDSQTNELEKLEEIFPENIPLSDKNIQDDNGEKHNSETWHISKVERALLEKSLNPGVNNSNLNNSEKDNFQIFPLVPKVNEELTLLIKPDFKHLDNTVPPPSPEDDFTDKLIKKVANMEESVEKEEFALKQFSYEELKGVDECVLRQRTLLSVPITTSQAAISISVKDKKPATKVLCSSLQADQKDDDDDDDDDKEVALIKFVEYFVYFIALLSLLLHIHRLLSWRPY